MIWLNPANVSFGSLTLDNVESVSIDRASSRFVEDYSDLGPHVVFADSPRQRVTVRIVRTVIENEDFEPVPGEMAGLAFSPALNASASSVASVSIDNAVVFSVSHDLSKARGATQTIVFRAVSSDGVTDPIALAAK